MEMEIKKSRPRRLFISAEKRGTENVGRRSLYDCSRVENVGEKKNCNENVLTATMIRDTIARFRLRNCVIYSSMRACVCAPVCKRARACVCVCVCVCTCRHVTFAHTHNERARAIDWRGRRGGGRAGPNVTTNGYVEPGLARGKNVLFETSSSDVWLLHFFFRLPSSFSITKNTARTNRLAGFRKNNVLLIFR